MIAIRREKKNLNRPYAKVYFARSNKMVLAHIKSEGQQLASRGLRKATIFNTELFLTNIEDSLLEINEDPANMTEWQHIREYLLTEEIINQAKIS